MEIVCPIYDQTLAKLMSQYVLSIDTKSFLDLKDPITGDTNWDRIQRKYNQDELDANTSKYPSGSLLVKSGTLIQMPLFDIKRDIPSKINNDIVKTTDFKPFISEQLSNLLKDPNYNQSIKDYNGVELGRITDNDVTVYVWCKALTPPNSTSQQGSWLNISAFCETVQTNVTENGGTFSITIPQISCQWDDILGWSIDEVIGYDTGSVRDDVLSQSSPNINDKRRNFLHNTVIQANDLVYIKFEKLSIDEELDTQLRTVNSTLSPNDIPNRVYDMIGLVDNVSMGVDASNVSVLVSGRDLSKILIEDGSYFFVSQFAQNIFVDDNSILSKRNRAELEALSFSAIGYTFKTIDVILKFIFNKFSNIGWVDNSAFNGYGSKALRKKYSLKTSSMSRAANSVIDQLNKAFLAEPRQGVWRIVDFIFDAQVAGRVLADNSIYRDAGSIVNSIRRICQSPFVEFYGDTYGDRYDFIVRKQPFDAVGYRGLVYENYTVQSTDFNTILKEGKLQIDDDKLKKKIDDRIKNERKTLGRESAISDLVIDISDVDVLSEQLTYHSEAYSWYRIIPRGLGIMDEESEFLLAPAISFDEYAKIYGNKSYEIEYNYAPSEFLQDFSLQPKVKYAEAQTFHDLRYIVQCSQYLPFTRTGRIVLVGDRRIKRGLFVHYMPTNEIFYVDSVMNIRGVSNNDNTRVTVLNVSRGMVEPYIKGKLVKFPTGTKRVSYFDIIKTSIDSNASIGNTEFLKNWKVDQDVFNYFVQRRQWSNE